MSTPPDLAEAVRDAFDYALIEDRDNLIEKLADIAGWGTQGLFTACWGWAAVVLMVMTGDNRPDPTGFYSLEITRKATGEHGSLEDAIDTPSQRAAMRMVTLYGNRDSETAIAIAEAMRARDGTGADLLMASVTLAAHVAMEHMKQHAEGCPGCPLDGGAA